MPPQAQPACLNPLTDHLAPTPTAPVSGLISAALSAVALASLISPLSDEGSFVHAQKLATALCLDLSPSPSTECWQAVIVRFRGRDFLPHPHTRSAWMTVRLPSGDMAVNDSELGHFPCDTNVRLCRLFSDSNAAFFPGTMRGQEQRRTASDL